MTVRRSLMPLTSDLGAIDGAVGFAVVHQLRVRPIALHAAVIEAQDPVGLHDRGNPLADEQHRGPARLVPESPEDVCLGPGIQGTGTVVEDENSGAADQRACQGETLLLSARQVHAALAKPGIVPFLHGFNELVGTGDPAGIPHFLLARILPSPPEVIPDGTGKKQRLLCGEGDGAPQVLLLDLTDICAGVVQFLG